MTCRHNWSEERVYYHDDQRRLKSMPIGWTSLGADDPFVVVAAGRAAFRATDLLELANLVDRLRGGHSDG